MLKIISSFFLTTYFNNVYKFWPKPIKDNLLKYVRFLVLQVMESEEFLILPVAQLVDIISSDELNVRSEEQVFNAIMSWLKYNVSERRQHLAQVTHSIKKKKYPNMLSLC